MENQTNNQQSALSPETSQQMSQEQVDPQVKQKIEGYSTVLINLIHDDKTANEVLNMLKGDPFITVPSTANHVNETGVNLMKHAGMDVTTDIQFGASSVLISDLIDTGNAAGVFTEDVTSQDQIQAIMEDTYQLYIQKGLKNKTIDPIKLQLDAEQFMTPEMKNVGDKLMQKHAVPAEPDKRAVIDQYATRKMKEVTNES